MKKIIQEVFKIRDGELRITLLMQLFIFLLITALLMLKTVVNAVFLDELPVKNLSTAYILVAIFALITTYFYNRILARIRLKWMIVFTLALFSLAFFTFGAIIQSPFFSDIFLYAFYVCVALYAVITTSQFWLLSNYIFNAREAKRLFSFIGAGAISGGILGGYLVRWLVDPIGITGITWAGAAMIALCIPISLYITNYRKRRLLRLFKTSNSSQESTSLSELFSSKHVIYLALVVALSVIVARLVDYQFSSFAQDIFVEATELSRFFGFWFSTFNIIALALQLFVTHRLLKLLGVTSNLLLLPVGVLFAVTTFIFIPELWVVILLKGLDGSFKQSINKASLELAVVPMPHHIKSQAKTFIDVVVDSVATGVAGIMLFVLLQQFQIDGLYIKLLTLILVLGWIFCVIKLRTEYFNSFTKILKKSIKTDKAKLAVKYRNLTDQQLKIILESSNAEQIINILPYVSKRQVNTNLPLFLSQLGHLDQELNLKIIDILPYSRKKEIRVALQNLLLDRRRPIIDAVLNYFIDDPYLSNSVLFNEFLHHPKRKIAYSALRCLAKQSANNERLAVRYKLNQLIDNRIYEVVEAGTSPKTGNLLMTIAHAKRKKYYRLIEHELMSPESPFIKKAIKAAGTARDPLFIPYLIKLLDRSELTVYVQKALAKYGDELIDSLTKLKRAKQITTSTMMLLAKPISRVDSRKSRDLMKKWLSFSHLGIKLNAARAIIRHNNETRRQIHIARSKLDELIITEAKKYEKKLDWLDTFDRILDTPTSNNSQLFYTRTMRPVLETVLDQHMEYIFRCLSLYYHKSDLDVVYLNLKSTRDKAKADALEFLENLINVRLKRIILPLIERERLGGTPDPTYNQTKWHDIIADVFQNGTEKFISNLLDLLEIQNNPEDLDLVRQHKFKSVSLEKQKDRILNSIH